MENISLYRKYRPQNFDNLVGQKHILTTLTNALKRDNLAHAYLFAGPRGTGKTSMARLFAKSINCTDLKENFEPCDKCDFCQEINAGRLIDLIEIDAASNRGIDEIRDLKEKINFAPTRSKWKIYIIDEVHMLTKEAFNALLKTLEEPPSNVFFILATTEIHKIPETIISRCQRFDFRRIADEDVASRLKKIAELENFEVEEGAIDLIVEYAHGGLRDAIGLLEQLAVEGKIELSKASDLLGLSDRKLLDDFVQVCFERNIPRGLALVTDIFNQGLDVKNFLHEVLGHLRKKMLKQVNDGNKAELNRSLELIEIFQKAKEGYNFSIPQLWLEVPLLQACLEGKDQSFTPSTTEKQVKIEKPAVVAPTA